MYPNSLVMDQAAFERVFIGFKDALLARVIQPSSWVAKLAMPVTSESFAEEYLINPNSVRLRKREAELGVEKIQLFSQKIKNEEFVGTVEVKYLQLLDALRNGKTLAQLDIQMAELKDSIEYWERDLCAGAIINGHLTQTYDGQFFFDAAHPQNPSQSGGPTQSNLHTALPLTAANYATVRARRAARLDSSGNVRSARSTALVVPTALEGDARIILSNEYGANGASNQWQGSAEIIVVDELSKDSASTWYLADLSSSVKPIVLQKKGAPTFSALDRPDQDHVFKTGNCLYKAEMSGNAQGIRWDLMDKVYAV